MQLAKALKPYMGLGGSAESLGHSVENSQMSTVCVCHQQGTGIWRGLDSLRPLVALLLGCKTGGLLWQLASYPALLVLHS